MTSAPPTFPWQIDDVPLSPEEAKAKADALLADIEAQCKNLPPAFVEFGAQKFIDFLKGEVSWAEMFNVEPATMVRLAEFGYLQYKTGRYEEAERFFRVLTMLNWNNGEFHAMLGLIYQQQKRPAEAIMSFTQAITVNAHDGRSLVARASLHLQHGWWHAAQNDVERALALPESAGAEWGKRAKALVVRIKQVKTRGASHGG